MKKYLFVLASVLAAVSASATPLLGDHAEFAVTASKNGQSINGTAVFELTAFDSSRSEFTQRTTMQWDGRSAQSQEDKIAMNEMINDETIDYVLAGSGCAENGGVLETVTVPAGTFPTCKVVTNDGASVWVGKVALAIVRYEVTQNGLTQVFLLKSFQNGK